MKTIAIDFDGVIHKYSKGWQDGTCYDEPVEGALLFIWDLLQKGYSVFVLSTRNPNDIEKWFINVRMPYGVAFDTHVIPNQDKFWNQKYCVGITDHKLPAHIYIDDRGIRFEGNFNELMHQVEGFKTWQEIIREEVAEQNRRNAEADKDKL